MNIFELFILAIGLSMDAFLSVRAFPWAESMQSICVSQAHGSGDFRH